MNFYPSAPVRFGFSGQISHTSISTSSSVSLHKLNLSPKDSVRFGTRTSYTVTAHHNGGQAKRITIGNRKLAISEKSCYKDGEGNKVYNLTDHGEDAGDITLKDGSFTACTLYDQNGDAEKVELEKRQ